MNKADGTVKIETAKWMGRWYWRYELKESGVSCPDIGLDTEEQAIEEAWHVLRRHLEVLAQKGDGDLPSMPPRSERIHPSPSGRGAV